MNKTKQLIIFSFCVLSFSCKKKVEIIDSTTRISKSFDGINVDINHGNQEFKTEEADNLNSEAADLAQNGDLRKARIKFIKALAIEPKNVTILNNFGLLERLSNNSTAAIKYFQKSLILSDSTYLNAASNLGLIYYNIGETQKSIDAITFVISKSENSTLLGASYFHLSMNYLDIGNCDEAKYNLEKARKVLGSYESMKDQFDYEEKRLENCIKQHQ